MDEQSEIENLDSTNETTEEVENTEEVVEEETPVVESEDETAKLKETNKRLFERAKKAEAEAKALKAKAETAPKTESTAQVDPDELRLLAKGLSDEEIERAKIIAKGSGISLVESLKDPMFIAYQRELKEQQRKEKAKLGASKGSGQADEEPLVKSGMSDKEHEEVWKKAMGR